jgi:hypothetical protein
MSYRQQSREAHRRINSAAAARCAKRTERGEKCKLCLQPGGFFVSRLIACFCYAVHGIDELLPWSWKNTKAAALAADLSSAFFCENVK